MSNPFLREIQKWIAASVVHEYDRWSRERTDRLLLGGLVYGERYIERFLRYCVPSMLSRGNLSGLASRPLLILHTDELGMPLLQEGLKHLAGVAEVELYHVSPDLVKATEHNRDTRYVLLGASELVHMKRAFYRGLNFHCLFPDVVYPVDYFANLQRLVDEGKECILSHSINARAESLGPLIEANMPAGRLTALALEHLHPRQAPYLMNLRNGEMPTAAHLVYASSDRVSIVGMHAFVPFLHHKLLGFGGLRLNTTLDAQVPFYLHEGVNVYMPQRDDGMTIVELSDADWTAYHKGRGCSLKEFAIRFWVVAEGERGFERIFGLTSEFPLEGNLPWVPMSLGETDAKISQVRAVVAEIHPEVERAFELGGVLEETGLHGPLWLPQDRMQEMWNARALA